MNLFRKRQRCCSPLPLAGEAAPQARVREALAERFTAFTFFSRITEICTNAQPVLLWCYLRSFPRFSMSTTSLKLPDDIKRLATSAAKEKGMSPHAFMVEAIRTAAVAAKQRAEFVADAEAARTQAMASGKGFPASDVHAYLRARVRGLRTSKPKAKSWRS